MSRRLSEFSPKDRNLIKSALRRAFARSDLHKEIEAGNRIQHQDLEKHPRCQKFSWCSECGVVLPTYKTEIDHREPVIKIGAVLEDMTIAELAERIWCERDNLWVLCKEVCHRAKSARERALRPKRVSKKKSPKA